jgi:NAD(P)-dependent dehydrogenase (short-subunit alcohol dehydrogenase family)
MASPGACSPKLKAADLTGKVAIITGATRGIGRKCAIALAKQGCNIVIAAKSTTEQPNLPGSIYTVADEITKLGVQALPVMVDMRKLETIEECVRVTTEKFGRIDILINNASALWWHRIEGTPMNKYDLITQINARGSFAMANLCLPVMAKGGFGRVICMSPPIQNDYRAFGGFTAYNISKFGMTMVAMGAAAEYEGKGITGHSLWPATVIESQASKNFEMGSTDLWRKADILADAVLGLVSAPDTFTGRQLIDDEYLMEEHGFTEEDLAVYRFNPEVEPPRALAPGEGFHMGGGGGSNFNRGDVRKLKDDQKKDNAGMFSKL